MKRAAIAISILLVASISLAAETGSQSTTTAKEPARTTTVAAAAAQPASDSPLVRAAKTTNRAKKRIVITNESLKNSTGHVTTTKNQPPVYEPKLTEKDYQDRRADTPQPAAAKPAANKAEETKSMKLQRLAAESDDPYSDMDPAMLEHQLEKNAQQAPKEEKKKP